MSITNRPSRRAARRSGRWWGHRPATQIGQAAADGRGQEAHAVDRVVLAAVVDRLAREQPVEDVERLVEHPGPTAVVGLLAEARQLAPAAVEPEPDAEHEAPARQVVEGDGLAGHDLRAPAGERRDHRSEQHALGAHRHRGHGDPRVGRRLDGSAVHDVVPHEHAVPARRLGRGREVGEDERIGELVEDRQGQPGVHARILAHPIARGQGDRAGCAPPGAG